MGSFTQQCVYNYYVRHTLVQKLEFFAYLAYLYRCLICVFVCQEVCSHASSGDNWYADNDDKERQRAEERKISREWEDDEIRDTTMLKMDETTAATLLNYFERTYECHQKLYV